MVEKTIMSSEDVRRALARLAHEIVEGNPAAQDLAFVGIVTRGVPLAERLAEYVKEFAGFEVPVGSLDISLHRDDIGNEPWRSRQTATEIPFELEAKSVVLVDDVLYTGRTVRAAMDALVDIGRPQSIQLAVMVDRGHRELPIRPHFVGKSIPTSSAERVQVCLDEIDGADGVVLVGQSADGASSKLGTGIAKGVDPS
ncbi:bifunctional pyr operon transcriptional regulator/uracil phosphoribosyltransferase PyrR [Dehalococcoidia bacterium]|nr:bifunctional pyr operon transcriptional regulator/uracil phosphoribosyltransferase PyrR [Dehalococcoidia bacterium]